MPLHISHELAVEIKHVGVLALIGKGMTDWGYYNEEAQQDEEKTPVFFLLQYREDAPLAYYLFAQSESEKSGILHSLVSEDAITSATDEKVHLIQFERLVDSKLREPNKFLHATADKLLKELQALEEEQLNWAEQDDEYDWALEHHAHYMQGGRMPDFKRPRHVD